MLGIIFWQRDREAEEKDPDKSTVAWVHPFLMGTQAEKDLGAARTMFAEGKTKEN
jgi:hypothetical protein